MDVTRLNFNDFDTGATLWRKYKEIRLIQMNDFVPLLQKRLPGSIPPSGKSFADVLFAVRKEVLEIHEDIFEKKSKALRRYKRHAFIDSWFPLGGKHSSPMAQGLRNLQSPSSKVLYDAFMSF